MKAFNVLKSLKDYETYLEYGAYFTFIGLLIQGLGLFIEKWTIMKLGYLFIVIGVLLLIIPLYIVFRSPKKSVEGFGRRIKFKE